MDREAGQLVRLRFGRVDMRFGLINDQAVRRPSGGKRTARHRRKSAARRVHAVGGHAVTGRIRRKYVLTRGNDERAGIRSSSKGTRSEEHTSELQSRLHLVC